MPRASRSVKSSFCADYSRSLSSWLAALIRNRLKPSLPNPVQAFKRMRRPGMREKVIFPTNVPVTVTLAFQDGLDVEGRFGDQVMYTLEDGRVMYVAPMVRRIPMSRRRSETVIDRMLTMLNPAMTTIKLKPR